MAERKSAPAWAELQRDDFRAYVRFLGRNRLSRAATQLRFSALRTFYKFLMRHGVVETMPIKNLVPAETGKAAATVSDPTTDAGPAGRAGETAGQPEAKKGAGRPISAEVCRRDVAVLETIYSCGLRISELCGLRVEDIDFSEQIVRVRGKGKKERLRAYWRAGTPGHRGLLGAVAGSRRRGCNRCSARTPAKPRRSRRSNCRAG